MKNLLLCVLLLAPVPPLSAQLPGIDQDSELLIVPPDDKFVRWHGHPGRTYFIQTTIGSAPLGEWLWMPVIDSGTGFEISHEVGGTGPRGFYRLHYTDMVRPAGVSREDWDIDGDGLSNQDEIVAYQTHPLLADTDGDDLTDGEEATQYGGSPRLKDSDGDGLDDYEEGVVHGTDPWLPDSDRDGVSDLEEVNVHFTDPLAEDSDADGMPDGWELTHGLDPLDGWDVFDDPDADGVPNRFEHDLSLDPQDDDTDDDTVRDGDEDSDRDGLANSQETSVHGTSPVLWDTDADGMPDGWEVANGLDALIAAGDDGPEGDPDGDDLSNFDEWLNGTAADDINSDDDPENDGGEVAQGSNPKDAADNGVPPPAKDLVEVPFTVSDPSISESEKWKMIIVGKGPEDTRTMGLASVEFGEPATKTLKLRKWNRYEITVEHLATDPEPPVSGETDYDWEATVDGLPTTVSQVKTETSPGVNNFFIAAKYWLVDNREVVFTTEKHGNEENIVTGKTAVLVPIEIGDKLAAASGVDDVSVTAAVSAGGYQDDFWIMAPMGGVEFSDSMYFKIPVDPATPLDFTCANATPAPATVNLDFDSWRLLKEPEAAWRGLGAATTDNAVEFHVGEDNDLVDLPIRVKSMKKRTVTVKVWPVRHSGEAEVLSQVFKDAVTNKLNEVFAFQINAWFDVTFQDEVLFDFRDGTHYSIPYTNRHGVKEKQMIDAQNDSAFDINVYLIRGVSYYTEAPPDGSLLAGSSYPSQDPDSGAYANRCVVNRSSVGGNARAPSDIIYTISHEIGHLLVGPGHPDQHIEGLLDGGPAPLQSLPVAVRTERLMAAGGTNDSKFLVKSEWDAAEEWLSSRPNGDD